MFKKLIEFLKELIFDRERHIKLDDPSQLDKKKD
jgi:hypothetical protein